ncbi:MAG: L,D-transpeptidase family protein [Caulobacteraceae bacterium]
MRLRLALASGAIALIGLAGCDDFRTKPAANAPPVAAPAPPPAVAAVPPPSPTPPPAALAPASTSPAAQAIDNARFVPGAPPTPAVLIRAETILDRAHFSPGQIDGRAGSNLSRALAAFEAAHGLTPAGPAADTTLGPAAWKALLAVDPGPVTADYVITVDDEKGPFIGRLPAKMPDQARLAHLGYTTPLQELAERFHMSQALLKALNPGANFAAAGTRLVAVQPGDTPLPPVAKIEVDKSNDEVRAYDAAGALVGFFPATVGSTERPAPSGTWAVKSVVRHPDYTYDPRRLTFGPKSKGVFTIKPGPNNPVGSIWIDLTYPTYGIHGAPDPSLIGKTASHGCVRLTNWDANLLGDAVAKGTPVVFLGAARPKA